MDPSGFFRKNRTGFVVLMGRKEWIFESDYSACGCGDHDLCSDGTRNLQTGCAIPFENIYPLIHAIYYVDTVEIVEIEKQYKQECV